MCQSVFPLCQGNSFYLSLYVRNFNFEFKRQAKIDFPRRAIRLSNIYMFSCSDGCSKVV